MIVSFFAPGLCGLKGSTSSAPFPDVVWRAMGWVVRVRREARS